MPMASARFPATFLIAMAVSVASMTSVVGAPGAKAAPPAPAVDPLFLDGVLEERAFRLWKAAGSGFHNTEHAAWLVVSDDSDVSFVEWPRRSLRWKEVWRGPPP